MALRYRGNVLTRMKMWFQESDPMENVKGFLKYFYTGWQYKVMPATAGVEKVPWWRSLPTASTTGSWGFGQPWTNHHIVTMYEKEDCGIGMHYDKPKSIDPNSVILVVKTGDCGRPFRITDNRGGENQDKELFCDVVAPGDAVLMSMKANLATKHGVPIVTQPTGMSGSIVMRRSTSGCRASSCKRSSGGAALCVRATSRTSRRTSCFLLMKNSTRRTLRKRGGRRRRRSSSIARTCAGACGAA